MKFQLQILILTLVSLLSVGSMAKTLKSEAEMEDLVQKFFVTLTKKNPHEAVKVLGEYLPVLPEKLSKMVTDLENERSLYKAKNFGVFKSFSKTKLTKVSEDLLKISALEKYENHFVIWTIYFYRPESEWQANSVFWTTKADTPF